MRTLLPALLLAASAASAEALPPFRPPAVPLVSCDPYFSIWSHADRLTDDATRHWTKKRHALTGLIRVDGKTLRLMGDDPADLPALPQTGLDVQPTRSTYAFEGEGVRVSLTFLTPGLPDDLDALSRPVTYLTWKVASADGKSHEVALYVGAAAEIAVDVPAQKVLASRLPSPGLTALRAGSEEQPVLGKRGDDRRIDWGWLLLAASDKECRAAIGAHAACVKAFADTGTVPAADDTRFPRAAGDDTPVLALSFALGPVKDAVSRTALVAYDDEYSILYFGRKLRPYWRRNGLDAAGLLAAAAKDHAALAARGDAFDRELMDDARRLGGEAYARIIALAYRQCLAGNKLAADPKGQPVYFPKENHSNGCIGTVDVFYPMLPQFLLLSPSLAKAACAPLLVYAASDRWKFPFAPHDLGQYPHATGQVYGGGERTEDNQMPVEESGNMLLLCAGIARADGNTSFSDPWWPVLTTWAAYLADKGFDPENQLCTDDFAGHLAHNVNLSAKAILGLAAYAEMARMRGDKDAAAKYRALADSFAARWIREADDGTHFRLAFDKPGTWSQKYNLAWDRVLGLNVFPPDIARKELAFYRTVQNRYGLPLDNRSAYTKLDWILWTATLTGKREDFDALVGPVHTFLQETPDRFGMTDWYWTDKGTRRGFTARPVIGGVFMQMLTDPATWAKWSKRDRARPADWAPLPRPPQTRALAPTSESAPQVWKFTTSAPPHGWEKTGFDDDAWKSGPGGFGTDRTPGIDVRTPWNTPDIWLRRAFDMPAGARAPQLSLFHDEDAEIFIDGIPAAKAEGFTTSYVLVDLTPAARAALTPGRHTLALHCRQTEGGQGIDAGLVEIVQP